jgi:D-alanyl-D-alanine endopeptidase (penicillin-binding protein 7)
MRLKIFIIIAAFYSALAQAASMEHSVLVYNNTTKQIVVEQNAASVRPIASITKLMTAMIVLDTYQLTNQVQYTKRKSVTVDNLLTNMLVRSDNHVAETFANTYPGGRVKFIEAMNLKAVQLGLHNTHFDDASGLSAKNVSTAAELARLVTHAGTYEFIRQTSTMTDIPIGAKFRLPNTNKAILVDYRNITLSKTGYTNPAGRCLALMVNSGGSQYTIIILGEPNKNMRERLARTLLKQVDS